MSMSNTIDLSENLSLSRIVHGHWRLAQWRVRPNGIVSMIHQMLDWGVTTFDHADIYGDYECESLFGQALSLSPEIRDKIQLVTKCGIKLRSGRYPERKVKIYDYTKEHIIASAEQSLINFRTDRIDLLLLHRPAPFFDPMEVAEAFAMLKKDGKVLNFGVSNFSSAQIGMLQKYCVEKLLTNQVEISPLCLDEFENGNMEYYLKEKMPPMAWSPLAGGKIFTRNDSKTRNLMDVINEIGQEIGDVGIETLIYAWLLKHPSHIIPIVGSGRPERVKMAVDALGLDLSLEQWYRIYIAAKGEELP